MNLILTQNVTATSPGMTASFLGVGGTGPYTYSVRPNGAGGTINASTGIYTAPAQMSEDPEFIADTIQVRDSLNVDATAQITVGNALILFCDILQNQLGLDSNHIYVWNQKLFQPTDSGLYIAVSVMTCKPFGNDISFDGSGSGLNSIQTVNMQATLDVDIISRGPAARDRKEFVLMALQSVYSEQQQEANSFHISRLPASSRFINLSDIDGSAIPYRYKISFNIQYTITNVLAVPYFNTFAIPSVSTNP